MIEVVLTLVVVGLIVWLEETYLPLPAPFKTIIRVVVIICVLAWLLGVFGVLSYDVPVPTLRR